MWQREYEREKSYLGLKPEKCLREVIKYAPRGKVLDIGAGQGRNSIFLAQNGFQVEAIDKDKEELKKCKKFAKKHSLLIKTKVIDIRKFRFEENKYSLILSITTLDFLKLPEIKKIIKQIKKSLKKGGIFYLVVFSTDDPVFKKCKNELKMIEESTFFIPRLKIYRHFFTIEEILNLLKGFKILKIEGEKSKDISQGKIHYHWLIRTIVKKQDDKFFVFNLLK